MSFPRTGLQERMYPVAPDGLPNLRLPRDRVLLPRICGHCGGGLLDIDESRGETAPGRVVCVLCSRTLAWCRWER